MPTTFLGKTRFNIQGAWSAGTTYSLDDIVFYNGGWYIATQTSITAGTLPTNVSFWSAYETAFNWRGTHVNTNGTSYLPFDTVTYTVTNTSTAYPQLTRTNRQTYVCILAHTSDGTNTYLPLNSTYWQPITSQGQRIGTSITVGTATSLDQWGIYGDDPRKIIVLNNKGRAFDATSNALNPTVNPYYAKGTGKNTSDAYQGFHYVTADGGVGASPQSSTNGSSGILDLSFGPCSGALSFFFHDFYRSASISGQSGVHSTPDNNIPRAIQVERGYDHGCVLFNNGEVYAWGNNANYGLGDRSTTTRTQPVRCGGTYTEVAVAASTATHTLRNTVITRISMSSAGNICGTGSAQRHTLALDSSGNVWAWGYNLYGQCGNGTTTDVQVPTQIPTASFGSRPVVAIWAFGGQYGWNFAINDQNTLYAWGYNGTGQLGNGTTTVTGVLTPTANTQTWTGAGNGTITKITSIGGNGSVAGSGSTAILTSLGRVYVAGTQTTGQFMVNSVTQQNTFTRCTSGPGSPASTNGASNVWLWGDPAAGIMMVRDAVDGTTWSAGYNTQYNLGDGASNTNSSVALQSKKWERGAYSNLTNVADMASLSGGTGTVQSCMVITDSGFAYGIGSNASSQLGFGWQAATAFNAPGDGNGIDHNASAYAWLPVRLPSSLAGKCAQVQSIGYKDNATTTYGGFVLVSREGRAFICGNGSSVNGFQMAQMNYAYGNSDANHNVGILRSLPMD